jgi:hypothetical protein
MKKTAFILFFLLSTVSLSAGDFVTQFLEKCIEEKKPVNNINIGKSMLEKMASNTDDEDLKKTFRNLNSIRIITCDNIRDSRLYFKKANNLALEEFKDYQELVSLNEKNAKIHIYFKQESEKLQDLIFIGLDEEEKLSIITITGKIDFASISKLSDSLNKEMKIDNHGETPSMDKGTK